MSNWKKVRLGAVCNKVYSGGTPKSTEPSYYGGSIPWLNTKEVGFNRIYETEKNITESGFSNSSAKWVPENSIIIAMYGATAGKVAINKIPLTTNQACCNLIIDEDSADYRFIYYTVCVNYAKIASMANGGAQQNLNSGLIKDFEIDLPSLEEQERIAAILGSLDDKIELNNKINRNLEAQAEALFKQWFVDFDFPDPNSNIIELGEVIETTSGGTPSRVNLSYYENGDFNWVKSKELNNSFIINTEECITKEAINKSSAKILPKHSILIAIYGATVGEFGVISKEMTCNQAICALKPNKNYPYTFLYYFAKNIKAELINLAVGSAQQNISQQLIKSIKITTNLELIDKFHENALPFLELIEANQQENLNLIQLRDSLLPKLMNNEI